MDTSREARINEAVRELTKTMPIPVAKSYARKVIDELLDDLINPKGKE